jgi:hypothetical protein
MEIGKWSSPPSQASQDTAESMLYEMIMALQVSRNPFATKDVDDQTLVNPLAVAAVRQRLQTRNIDYQLCDVDISEIDFKDVSNVGRVLYFFGIELHSHNFVAGYVLSGGAILSKYENQ